MTIAVRRPVDWSPLAATDLVPGDPDQVDRAGRGYTQEAEAAHHVALRLRKIADSSDMQSLALFAWRIGVYAEAQAWDAWAENLADTSRALTGYAPVLEEAQHESLHALRQAQDAESDLLTHREPDG